MFFLKILVEFLQISLSTSGLRAPFPTSIYLRYTLLLRVCFHPVAQVAGCFLSPGQEFFCGCQRNLVGCIYFRELACGSDVDRLRLCDRHTVSVLTQHFLCGEGGPLRQSSPDSARHSRRLFTPADTPPSTPFQPFSSLLFNNPGNLNRWKRASEPAASTQIEVLSCMVIRPSHENGSVLFLPEPQLPSSFSRQRLVWTPVGSTAKISVVPRKGSVSGWWG